MPLRCKISSVKQDLNIFTTFYRFLKVGTHRILVVKMPVSLGG